MSPMPEAGLDGGLVAAKPRVHEIASAFGVDSKTALRMLKDDGEFVKGPSSSVEPAVARRLRARLTAEGHVDQSVGASTAHLSKPEPASARLTTPRPTPAPPGTRWTATEPFVAYTKPARTPAQMAQLESLDRATRVARETQRAADKADRIERKRQATILRVKADERAGLARREAHTIAAAAVSQRQKEYVAKNTGLSRIRAEETAARAGEVAAKGRARAAAERAATADRETRRARDPRPPRVFHEDESRRAARRAVVSRSETDWQRFGIVRQERMKWETAGLRPDQAHIPAMCRAFGRPGWRIDAGHLRVALRNGRTVLEEFSAGSNVVQVMDQLALTRKKEFRTGYDSSIAAILPALRDFAPEGRIRSVPFPDDLTATGVPKIADHILLLLRPSRDESLIDTFNRECRVYGRDASLGRKPVQRPGRLVQLYAEAHGVFGNGVLTDKLLSNLPMHVTERRLPMSNLIHDALRERQFYYLSASASLSVDYAADGRIQIPEEYDLPSPTGFAVLNTDNESDNDGRVLLWSHGADELTAAVLSIADLRAGVLGPQTVVSARVGAAPGDDEALALTTAIAEMIRRPTPLTADKQATPVRPRVTASSHRSLRTSPDTDANSDHVALIYAPGEARPVEARQGAGRKADHRWVVRGHWRQQPYPSKGETRPVYIKPHESGAADGDLWIRDRVRVPRST